MIEFLGEIPQKPEQVVGTEGRSVEANRGAQSRASGQSNQQAHAELLSPVAAPWSGANPPIGFRRITHRRVAVLRGEGLRSIELGRPSHLWLPAHPRYRTGMVASQCSSGRRHD
jgi:hypothetical protein